MAEKVEISNSPCQPTSTKYLGKQHVSNATADTVHKTLSVAAALSDNAQTK
jgi:hypothetical protein